jgi:hypothetical protein
LFDEFFGKRRDRQKAASQFRIQIRFGGPSSRVDIALRLHFVDAVLGDDLGHQLVLALKRASSCSEDLFHLAPMSLRRIFLASAGPPVFVDAAFGFTVSIDEISSECASLKQRP